MSSDMYLMARLLAAVKAGEGSRPFNVALVDPAVLRCTAEERDRMAVKLARAGYVDGLLVIDGIGFDYQSERHCAKTDEWDACLVSKFDYQSERHCAKTGCCSRSRPGRFDYQSERHCAKTLPHTGARPT